MLDKISNYKDRALASLKGRWDKGVIATLIFVVIYELVGEGINFLLAPNAGTAFQGLWSLLLVPLAWGFAVYFLRLKRDEDISYSRLFDGFKDYVRIFLTMLLVAIYTFLWSLLLVVPGVIKAISYSMTSFILKDNPELSYNAAIERSMAMMEGRKASYFLLQLSFIGWVLLSILTFGLGFLLLIPYMQTAAAHFYEDAKADYEAQSVI